MPVKTEYLGRRMEDGQAAGLQPLQSEWIPLEERIMFDAAGALDAAQALADTDASDHATLDTDTSFPDLQAASVAMSTAPRAEVYFVDAGLTDLSDLIAEIPSGAEVILLDASSDGVVQIAAALDGRSGLDAIHILVHGEEGRLFLGDTTLDAASIAGAHKDTLSLIGQTLSPDGDILVYGCDFTAGAEGLAAAQLLAAITGADIAASDDLTGHAGRGGDWVLEASVGAIETEGLQAQTWDGVLAPPTLTLPTAPLAAQEDTPLAITTVRVADADGDALSVTLGASNGTLTLAQTTGLTVTGNGSAAVTLSGSIANINGALNGMTFNPLSNYNGAAVLNVAVSDGGPAVTGTVGIGVAAVNDAPSLTPTDATADEGGSVVLTDANFGVFDPDLDVLLNTNPQLAKQLVFKLDGGNLPAEGSLRLNGAQLLAGSTFSLQDVRDGRLSYAHSGSDVLPGDTDDFSVFINDGGGSGDVGPSVITINLNPVNQAPTIGGTPTVFEGQGTEDVFANPGTVTGSVDIGASLAIADRDDTPVSSTITITNVDNAGEGTLFWDANGNGILDSGEELTGGESFAASDLAAGFLRFVHNGAEPDGTNPTFDIEVTDAGGGGGAASALSSDPQTITIGVTPNNDNPVLTTNTSAVINAAGPDTVQILPANLNVTDPDTGNVNLVYTVTAAPTEGELRLDGEILGVGATFTQADITAGRIEYRVTESFNDGDTDSFRFEVRDSTLRAFNLPGQEGADRATDGSIIEHTFTIDLVGNRVTGSPPSPPDRSGTVDVATSVSTGVTVIEGDGARGGSDTVAISAAELSYALETRDLSGGSTAVDPAQVVYRITSLPGNGTLFLNGVPLSLFSNFTQKDVNDGLLEFVHDGSENHQDNFEFSVSGGTGSVFAGSFALNAIPTNDAPTTGASDLPLLPEGGTARLTVSQISLGDVDTDDEPGEGGGLSDPNGEAVQDDLLFWITDLPDNGELQRWTGAAWVPVTTDDLMPRSLLTSPADGQTSGLRYVHDGSENHADSFTFLVRDDLTSPVSVFDVLSRGAAGAPLAGNFSGASTVNVALAPLNDPPIAPQTEAGADQTIIDANNVSQTTANDPLFLPEGGTSVIDTGLLKTVDPDNTDLETLQYRVTALPGFGTLLLGGNTLGVGSTFTQADIDAGRLSYTHDGSENFADTFRFIVSDSVNDHVFTPAGAGGQSTFSIFVNPARNDPPEIQNTGSPVVDLFGTFSHDFGTALQISDPDIDDGNVNGGAGETDFLQVTITLRDSVGNPVNLSGPFGGGITLGSTAGVTLTDSDVTDGEIVLQGSYAAVQAALTNLEVELPNTDLNEILTLDVTVDDQLRDVTGALTGGANGDVTATTNEDGSAVNDTNNRDTVSIQLRASDDNDDPFLVASPGDTVVNEDTVLSLAGYVIEDVDAFDSALTVTLSVTNGNLSVGGPATTASPSSLTLTGTVAQINAQLANLTYVGDLDFHSADGTTRIDDDTLVITVNDGGANGTGGGGTITLTPTNIAINPVNDRPTVTVPGTQTLGGGTSITFSGPLAPTVGDAQDAGNTPFNDVQRLIVGVPPGAGTLTGSGASGLSDLNGLSHVLIYEGTLGQLNAELNGLTFTPTDPNADVTVPISVRIEDMANGGTALANGVGGQLTQEGTFNVQISNFNDGPSVNTLTNQSVNEDSSLVFSTANGNAFTISDPDDFNRVMVANVSVNDGVLTAAAGSGATVVGNGTLGLTITGTEAQINAALNGLRYTPDGDFHTSGVTGDTITVSINDQGNTGVGGAISATQTAAITVNPVNDRPVASGGPVTLAAAGEDQVGSGTTLSGLLSGNYSDATDDQTAEGGGNTATPLSFVAITGSTNYAAGQGVWQVSDGAGGWIDVPTSGLSASSALVVEAGREIRFLPAADFFGTPGTLDVRLADGDTIDTIAASTGSGDLKDLSSEGGTGQSGRWSAGTVTLQTSVTAENDPPTASNTTLASVLEDAAAPPGATVSTLFGPVYGDATDNQSAITGGGNASTALGGIAIVGSAADPVTEGTWQYSTDGGTSWTGIPQGANDDTMAILLPNSALLRFVPVTDFNGTPGQLGVRLADVPQIFNASADISGVVGDDPSRSTDIWSPSVALNTSITPVNDAPSAGSSQNFNVGEDDGTQTVVGFMQSIEEGGGSDEDSQTVTFAVTGVSDGSVYTAAELFASQPVFTTATGAGNTLGFVPSNVLAAGETQTVTVTVSVTDDGGTANGGVDTGTPQTFTITIVGANDAPQTTGIEGQSDADGDTISLDVSGSFSDPDGTDVLRFSATGLPPGLLINPTTGEITGTIDFDASTGGPYTVTITATDFTAGGVPTGTSVQSSFTWSVGNPAPVANDDTDTTNEDTAITRTAAAGVIQPNDADGGSDGDSLAVDQINGSMSNVGLPVAGSTGGLFTVNADGSYTFDPNGEFESLSFGATATTQVTYRISDGQGGFDTATLTVTVTGANDAPQTTGIGGQSDADGDTISLDVSGSFSDPDGTDVLRFSATGLPPGLLINPTTGEITGTIDFDASTGGPYTVTITATDFTAGGVPTGTSVQSSFTWSVGNPAPVANDDTDTTNEDTAITRTAAAGVIQPNDADGGSDGDLLAVDQINGSMSNVGLPVAGSTGGLFTVNADGSYTFDPNGEFESLSFGATATTQVTYRISDGQGGFDTATLTVTVTGANDAPVANPDTATAEQGMAVSGNVLTNDADVDGSLLSVNSATVDVDGDGLPDPLPIGVPTLITGSGGTAVGTLTLNANGTFTFAPDPAFLGPVPQVSYVAIDASGQTASSTLTITITPVSPAFLTARDPTSGADLYDEDVRDRPRLIVDHIVDETANSTNSLFGTPVLLSGLNTSLGVEHPILVALNGLQSLDGMAQLSTRGEDVFGGLRTDAPITQTVRSIGFDRLDDDFRIFNRDFPDGIHLDRTDSAQGPLLSQIVTARLDPAARLAVTAQVSDEPGDGAPVLRLGMSNMAGGAVAVATVTAKSGGSDPLHVAHDGATLYLSGIPREDPVTVEVGLGDGEHISFVLMLPAQGDELQMTELASNTFSSVTERIAYADKAEAAELLQALKWGNS